MKASALLKFAVETIKRRGQRPKVGMRSAILVAIFLAGCSMPYKTPVFEASPDASVSFPGARAFLKEGSPPLDILFVHGMCTTDKDWAESAIKSLYEALGGDATKVALVEEHVANSDILIYRQSLPFGGATINAKAIIWSPLTKPLKNQLCYDQTNKMATCTAVEERKDYPYTRASANRYLKDWLLNDCLADVMAYQGKSHDYISANLQQAILQAIAPQHKGMATMALAPQVASIPVSQPLIVVSSSLGSKMTFDALSLLVSANDKDTSRAAARTVDRMNMVFMQANQLPILSLADQDLGAKLRVADEVQHPRAIDSLAELIKLRRKNRPQIKAEGVQAQTLDEIRVIAFTDPNDEFSYALVRSPHVQQHEYPVTDVIVSNATTYFGAIENPKDAHMDYTKNDAVTSLIACGHPKNDSCK